MIGDILQPTHLLFVLVVALLVLGPKRLPEAGRALGKGLRDFRSAIGGEDDHNNSIQTQTTQAAAPAFETVPPTPAPPPPPRSRQCRLPSSRRKRPIPSSDASPAGCLAR